MGTKLIITSVEELQEKINRTLKSLKNSIGIYVSLNKTQKSIENILKKNKISTKKIFFIDCVTTQKQKEDVLCIHPNELDKLLYAIKEFSNEIKEKKFILLDSLSTLLIFNDENSVIEFVKNIVEFASEKNIELIAFSPLTKGEELLNKIFNFFDKVEKQQEEDIDSNEELIY